MFHFLTLAQTRTSWAWAVCLLAALGCSNHPALKKLPTVPVRGRVTLDGKPITFGHGTVAFVRIEGDELEIENWSVNGSIDRQGNYELHVHLGLNHGYSGLLAMKEGAPTGRYHVSVRVWEPRDPKDAGPAGEPKWLVPRKYLDSSRSGLVVDVVENPEEGSYDLHLRS